MCWEGIGKRRGIQTRQQRIMSSINIVRKETALALWGIEREGGEGEATFGGIVVRRGRVNSISRRSIKYTAQTYQSTFNHHPFLATEEAGRGRTLCSRARK